MSLFSPSWGESRRAKREPDRAKPQKTAAGGAHAEFLCKALPALGVSVSALAARGYSALNVLVSPAARP